MLAPTTDEILFDQPKAAVPWPPAIVTAPLLVLSSLEARVKLLSLLVEADLAIIKAATPPSPKELPAVTLNVEPTDTARLPPDLEADAPLPTFTEPLGPALAVPVLKVNSPDMP